MKLIKQKKIEKKMKKADYKGDERVTLVNIFIGGLLTCYSYAILKGWATCLFNSNKIGDYQKNQNTVALVQQKEIIKLSKKIF